MTRPALLATGFVVAALAVPQFAPAQGGGGNDRVYFHDRNKDNLIAFVTGELKESAAGIQVIAGGKVLKSLSPTDIVRIEYSRLPGLEDTDRLSANNNETREIKDAKDAGKVKAEYTAWLKKSGSADAKTRRFLEFREAMWAARAADLKSGTDFEIDGREAVQLLTAFARTYPKNWEVWPVSRTAARLLAELTKPDDKEKGHDYSGAASMLAQLGKNADLPAVLRAEAKVAEMEVMIRSGNRVAAEPVANALATDKDVPPSGPVRDRLIVLQAIMKAPSGDTAKAADLEKTVETVIARSTDPTVRAAARNALGEYYLMNNRPRDAMWEFLWSATVYTQDRDESIKAVARLAEVFDKLGDKEKAAEFRERLIRLKAG